MSNITLPSTNGLISNATARKVIGSVFAYSSLLLVATGVVDTALPTIDLAWVTIPAGSIVAGLWAVFQLTSTNPNVPTPSAIAKATASAPPAPVIGIDTGIPSVGE